MYHYGTIKISGLLSPLQQQRNDTPEYLLLVAIVVADHGLYRIHSVPVGAWRDVILA
jgi:hypothetical protein